MNLYHRQEEARMWEREDYDKLVEEKKKEKLNGNRPNLEYLVQAEVKQANLTGDPDWDRFLEYLQSALDNLKARDAQLTAELRSPSTVDPNVIMGIKIAMADTVGQITAVESILALPKSIKELGEKARLALGR